MMTSLGRALAVAAAALVAASGLVAAGPHADAAPTPWTFTTRDTSFEMARAEYGYWSVACPAGTVPISGGYKTLGNAGGVYVTDQVVDTHPGGSFTLGLENRALDPRLVKVFVECASSASVTLITQRSRSATRDGAGIATVTATCFDGWRAIAGSVGWTNANTRWIERSGPTRDGTGWVARGWNSVSGANLVVTVTCIPAGDLLGAQLVTTDYHNTTGTVQVVERTVTCPAGTRILNGGTEDLTGPAGYSGPGHVSYPALNVWSAVLWIEPSRHVEYRAWCIPAGQPQASFASTTPANGSATADPNFHTTFAGSDPAGMNVSFTWKLDDQPEEPCSSGTLRYAGDGNHTFRLWAHTPDGRMSPTALFNWTADSTAPSAGLAALPVVTLGKSVLVSWSGSDAVTGVASYGLRYRSAAYNAGLGDWVYPASWADLTTTSVSKPVARGSTLCVSVRAKDKVGNFSAWSAQRCTSRPLDDRALAASSAWTRGTGSAYWNGTFTQTKVQGKTLKRTGAQLSRVGIVATRCTTCGKVGVYVGSALVGRIDLHASSTKNRQVVMLPAFSPRSGTVTIKVLTAGQLVRIDGLVIGSRP